MKINASGITKIFLLSTFLATASAYGEEPQRERVDPETSDFVEKHIIKPHFEGDSHPDPAVENAERDRIERAQRWQRGEPQPQPQQ
jgi:hypothetical protein